MDAGLLLLHVRNVVDRRVELWRIVVDIPDVDDNDGQVGELVIEHTVLQSVYLRDDRVRINNNSGLNVKVSSNIDHFTLRPWQTCSFRHQLYFTGKNSAMLQLVLEDYSPIFPPPSIATYSFIQLSELGRRGANENEQASKRQQRGDSNT